MEILTSKINTSYEIEVVERKGLGHPDTIADNLAEILSCFYSRYTLKKFGYILHHDFDKLCIVGGSSMVFFGGGEVIKPIKVLLSGRASIKFGEEDIPIEKVLYPLIQKYFKTLFPFLPSEKIQILPNLSWSSSPGHIKNDSFAAINPRNFWFTPRGPQDLPELKKCRANDTVIGCSYWPLTLGDKITLKMERFLNSQKYKRRNPWIGSDIKVHTFRQKKRVSITICIPQISKFVDNLEAYIRNLKNCMNDMRNFIIEEFDLKPNDLTVTINNRDNYKTGELYLTVIGSSIESGDIGLVGRGNRINGLITPGKPMSIEAAWGKNPVYHVGKLYNIMAYLIAKELHEYIGGYHEVYIISQTGRDLKDPWKVIIRSQKNVSLKDIKIHVGNIIEKSEKITLDIVKRKIHVEFSSI